MILRQASVSQFCPVYNHQNLQNAVGPILLLLQNEENMMKKQLQKLKMHWVQIKGAKLLYCNMH